jgi:hypothetical protein
MADSQEIEAENLRKVNRSKWEEQIKGLEDRGGSIKLTIDAVDNSGSLGKPFTYKPSIYHQNKVESNTKTHVSSAIHLAVDSNHIETVYDLNKLFEIVRHSNKIALAEKIANIKRLNVAKKEAEYHRNKRPRTSSPSLVADVPPLLADAPPPSTDEIAEAPRSGHFWGS